MTDEFDNPHSIAARRMLPKILQWPSSSGKYKTWTPGPWTPSVDRVRQNMDRVHGPPIVDRVPGPPIFATPKITEVSNNKTKIK